MRRLVFLLAILVGSLSTEAQVYAYAQGGAWDVCERHTRARERETDVPLNLLTAISLAETGRWNDSRQAISAWPWAINAEGEGYFLPSKAAAIAKVRALRAEGVRSIDVGCMQVNLIHHGDAFDSLEAAFDPRTNVAYAAEFLTRLHDRSGSWSTAAGRYHSSTAKHGVPYRKRVVRLWQDLNNAETDPTPPVASPSLFTARPVDRDRVAALNERFKAKRKSSNRIGGAEKRRNQLNDWRSMVDRQPFTVLAAVQAARTDRKRRDSIKVTPKMRQEAFAEKRRKQLDQWRRRVADVR